MPAQFVGRFDRDAATIALELLHIGKAQAPSLRSFPYPSRALFTLYAYVSPPRSGMGKAPQSIQPLGFSGKASSWIMIAVTLRPRSFSRR